MKEVFYTTEEAGLLFSSHKIKMSELIEDSTPFLNMAHRIRITIKVEAFTPECFNVEELKNIKDPK